MAGSDAFALRISIRGTEKTSRTLVRISEAIRSHAAAALNEAARMVRSTAKNEYLSAAGDVRRVRGGTPRLVGHRTPKNRLGVLTGRLRSSIAIEEASAGRLIARVGTNVFYGRIHELTGAGRMRIKRPFLQPALADNQKKILALMARAVRLGIKAGES